MGYQMERGSRRSMGMRGPTVTSRAVPQKVNGPLTVTQISFEKMRT